jgi:hypothetical protein
MSRSPGGRHVLSSSDRASESVFGLIMVLTVTGSLSAAGIGREETRTLLIGGLGGNLAWGIVDAVMYLMNALGERGRDLVTMRRARDAVTAEDACRHIADGLPSAVAAVIRPEELESIRLKWLQLPALPERPSLNREDFVGAFGVFLIVFVSAFPVLIPFAVISDVMLALRVSNLVAIAMMFGIGCSLGRHYGYRSWHMGLGFVAIGVVLVGITIALGG